jgi:protocatechuate 3,4-dioxygenase alpha subunit
MRLLPTASQTVGPFFAFGLLDGPFGAHLVAADTQGAIRIEGVVYDGIGHPVPDAVVEIWQANRHGRYAHPADARSELPLDSGFGGFGRCGTDAEGSFAFLTVKPGPVPFGDGRMQAPHIDVGVFARGVLKRLVTRIYFPDQQDANAADPVLSGLEPADRSTLIARPDADTLHFDIRLQGPDQTVFFAL